MASYTDKEKTNPVNNIYSFKSSNVLLATGVEESSVSKSVSQCLSPWKRQKKVWTLWYTEWVINRDLLYSTVNYTQYSVIIYMVKESEKNGYVCVYIYIKYIF